jgi:hypothetical protein
LFSLHSVVRAGVCVRFLLGRDGSASSVVSLSFGWVPVFAPCSRVSPRTVLRSVGRASDAMHAAAVAHVPHATCTAHRVPCVMRGARGHDMQQLAPYTVRRSLTACPAHGQRCSVHRAPCLDHGLPAPSAAPRARPRTLPPARVRLRTDCPGLRVTQRSWARPVASQQDDGRISWGRRP